MKYRFTIEVDLNMQRLDVLVERDELDDMLPEKWDLSDFLNAAAKGGLHFADSELVRVEELPS